MTKLLVVAFQHEGQTYVHRAQSLGLHVRVLDCVDNHHQQLVSWYGDYVFHTQSRKVDVKDRVMEAQFDYAIIQEDADYVQTGLIIQSLREAGVRQIIAVTPDGLKRSLYRRCGAHRVIVAPDAEQAWSVIAQYLPTYASA